MVSLLLSPAIIAKCRGRKKCQSFKLIIFNSTCFPPLLAPRSTAITTKTSMKSSDTTRISLMRKETRWSRKKTLAAEGETLLEWLLLNVNVICIEIDCSQCSCSESSSTFRLTTLTAMRDQPCECPVLKLIKNANYISREREKEWWGLKM